MPLTRHQISSAYGLANPELYRAADKDDPDALLEGVAMAGLVGILRQLGDLAEFAAEMFHDLHEEAMSTAARGHGLMVRVQQLEAEFPTIEKAFLTRTDHASFFSTAGVDWHPLLHMEQNLITHGDLPRYVMDCYEECWGPPRLFLLDKFDVTGAGACLKRYTDPSFFRLETAYSETPKAKVQREKKSRKVKKKGSPWRNGGTPDITPTTSHVKLQQLFLEKPVESGRTNPVRLVNLKSRKLDGFLFNTKSRRSYMEKLLQTPSPEHKTGFEVSSNPQLLTWNADDSRDLGIDIPEISVSCGLEKSCQGAETDASSPNEQELEPDPLMDNLNMDFIDRDVETVRQLTADDQADEIVPMLPKMIVENELGTDRKGRPEDHFDGSHSEDLASEVDNYMDALATMDSEMETDNEGRPRNESGLLSTGKHGPDSQSIGNTSASDNGYSSFGKGRSSFSYSDTPSISTASGPFDGEEAAEQLPSTGTCETEVMDSSLNFTSANKDAVGSGSYDTSCTSGRDMVEASPSSSCTSAKPISFGPEKLGPDENGVNLADSSTAGVHSPDAMDGGDLRFTAKALQNLTDIPDLSPEEKVGNITIGAVLQSKYKDDHHSENLVNPDIGSVHSLVASKKDHFSHSANPEIQTSPDEMVPKVGYLIPAAEIHSESKPVSNAEADCVPPTRGVSYAEISVADVTSETSSSLGTEADETMADVQEINPEKASLEGTEECELTLTSDISSESKEPMPVTSTISSSECKQILDTSLKYHVNYSDDEGLGKQVQLDNVAIENVIAEEVALSKANTAKVGLDVTEILHLPSNAICSPSRGQANMQDLFCGADELHQNGLKSNNALSIECHSESKAKEQTCLLEVASEHLDSMPSEPLSGIPSSLEVSNSGRGSSPAEPNNNHLKVGDDPILPASSDQRDLEPETKSPFQSNVLNITIGALTRGSCDQLQGENPLDEAFQSLSLDFENISCLDDKDEEKYVNVSSESWPEIIPSRGLTSEVSSQSAAQEFQTSKQSSYLNSSLPSFGLLPEVTQTNMQGMPPLPPLPPMQWRIGKARNTSVLQKETVSALSPFVADWNDQFSLTAADKDSKLARDLFQPSTEEGKTEQHLEQFIGNMGQPSPLLYQYPAMVTDTSSQCISVALEGTHSVNPFLKSSAASNQILGQALLSLEDMVVQSTSISSLPAPAAEHTSLRQHVSLGKTPVQLLNQFAPEIGFQDEACERISYNSGECHHLPVTFSLTLPQPTNVEKQHQLVPPASERNAAQPSNSSAQEKVLSSSVGNAMWPVNAFARAPTFGAGKEVEIPSVKLPRPRSPLVDAVAAHDRSTLRKISERVHPSSELKIEETDPLLAQIRNKSFTLKPTVVARPSIQLGSKTNLKVAAILEKANTIRQAMAGSDEDDDSDSWSDS